MKRIFIVLVALLAMPAAPAAELGSFTALNHPRASGLDFTIGFPKAWTGRRPIGGSTVASFWTTPVGPGDSMMIVVPAGQDREKPDVTPAEFHTRFEDPAFEKTILAKLPNAKLLQKKLVEDYKYPAGYLDYLLKVQSTDGEHTVQVRNHIIYLGKQMIQVQFYFIDPGEADRLEENSATMREVLDSLEYPIENN